MQMVKMHFVFLLLDASDNMEDLMFIHYAHRGYEQPDK